MNNIEDFNNNESKEGKHFKFNLHKYFLINRRRTFFN